LSDKNLLSALNERIKRAEKYYLAEVTLASLYPLIEDFKQSIVAVATFIFWLACERV